MHAAAVHEDAASPGQAEEGGASLSDIDGRDPEHSGMAIPQQEARALEDEEEDAGPGDPGQGGERLPGRGLQVLGSSFLQSDPSFGQDLQKQDRGGQGGHNKQPSETGRAWAHTRRPREGRPARTEGPGRS
jgi:hypothetical protein